MPELWLNFKDPDGVTRRVRVDGNKFRIGRQSICDLAIADSRLSRVHAEIERFGDRWEISDAGSSNGTELMGSPVYEPVPIFNGNVLSLGGLELRVEITEPQAEIKPESAAGASAPVKEQHPRSEKTKTSGNSLPIGLILAVPVLALVFVAVAGGVAYLVFGRDTAVATANDDLDDPLETDEGPPANSTGGNKDKPGPVVTPANSGSPNGPTPTPANLSETARVEVNGGNFLRRIAQNDRTIFLTGDQAKRVGSKIKQLSGSSAVADNLRSAKQNGTKIKILAGEKNLKPQLLAVAAVARLGTSRGDVFETAKSMAEVLEKLNIQIGSELADDCLLMIAAYDQGAAGDTMKLRNMLQNLANDANESSRTIRTIWFLEKRGKITSTEFDRALTFLAVGTIAQNPKEFGVSTDALDI